MAISPVSGPNPGTYSPDSKSGFDMGVLSEEDARKVQELKKQDQEVRAHEQAHMAAGAGIVKGGANYQMEKGPDGRMYAVGGEVSIDTSAAETPRATVAKMRKVKAAALAPANPSGQDRSVASQASATEAQARSEMFKSADPKMEKGRDLDLFA